MNNFPAIVLDAKHPASPLSVPASKTALLLLDFHKFIVASQPEAGQVALAQAAQLRLWAREHGVLIGHCLIDLKATTPAGRKMAERANGVRDAMAGARDRSGEHDAVAAAADEYTFWRPPSHVSALGSYGLEQWLAQHGVESLLLAGFSTSGCVVNTAKGAADKGFVVTVLKDACGDKAADAHDMIVNRLLVMQAHVSDVATFTAAWPERDSGLAGTIASKLSI